MKKFYTLSLFLISFIGFSQVSLPFADSFSYTAGNLHTTNPWSVVGTPNATDHILLNGSNVTFDGIGTDAQVLFTSQTAGTVYYKFKLKVLTMAGVSDANGGYLAGFTQNTTTFGGTIWTKRVDDNTFNIGIETRTATGVSTTYTTGTYNTGTSYTVVVSYTFNSATTADDTAKLWINPTSTDETSPLLTDVHTGTDLTSIVSFFLRQDSITETPSVEIDDLKISLTFADVLKSSKFENIAGLSIYPNPVSNGTLFINTDANDEKSVSIFDVLGKQVLQLTTSNNAINVANLNGGIYIVKVTENGKTATRKLVIK